MFSSICCIVFGISFSYAQTLSSSQTVNVATGEMAFAFPLATVRGVAGNDFPISLYYKAGIRANDEASPAGLGFSYDPGMITRQVVFVPDDAKGNGSGIIGYERFVAEEADTDWWIKVINIILAVIGLAIAISSTYEFHWSCSLKRLYSSL